MRIGLFIPCYIDAFFPGLALRHSNRSSSKSSATRETNHRRDRLGGMTTGLLDQARGRHLPDARFRTQMDTR